MPLNVQQKPKKLIEAENRLVVSREQTGQTGGTNGLKESKGTNFQL